MIGRVVHLRCCTIVGDWGVPPESLVGIKAPGVPHGEQARAVQPASRRRAVWCCVITAARKHAAAPETRRPAKPGCWRTPAAAAAAEAPPSVKLLEANLVLCNQRAWLLDERSDTKRASERAIGVSELVQPRQLLHRLCQLLRRHAAADGRRHLRRLVRLEIQELLD